MTAFANGRTLLVALMMVSAAFVAKKAVAFPDNEDDCQAHIGHQCLVGCGANCVDYSWSWNEIHGCQGSWKCGS
jgi:hypothetical protein